MEELEVRYYYKKKDGSAYLCLKTPEHHGDDDYIVISKREWEDHLADIGVKGE